MQHFTYPNKGKIDKAKYGGESWQHICFVKFFFIIIIFKLIVFVIWDDGFSF